MEIYNRSYIWLSLYFSVFSFTNCFNSFKISLGKVLCCCFFLIKELVLITTLTLEVKIEYFEINFFPNQGDGHRSQ